VGTTEIGDTQSLSGKLGKVRYREKQTFRAAARFVRS
jgi:hypothetical protein